ncbi:MAG: hypothetical protein AUK53_11645 [Betaproteobacteria bacterium CG2_30_59_46]|nr:MAG: hypothetical protein AUK53_11645 [Betaproteobacteria bacterium CG2_30_59_46]
MNASIPATQNEDWGFWGTMQDHASAAWPLAISAVAEATGEDADTIRAFLDSRYGRHFADEVQNGLFIGQPLLEAIKAVTAKWMGWKIGKVTSRDYGIPRGLPYLTGFVVHCGIVEELAAA